MCLEVGAPRADRDKERQVFTATFHFSNQLSGCDPAQITCKGHPVKRAVGEGSVAGPPNSGSLRNRSPQRDTLLGLASGGPEP
jgi:hypothetical protein